MRVLILTNFYPPYEAGGQGKSCLQVVEGLRRRNHSVAVLTSMHGTNNLPQEVDGISRSLYLEMDLKPRSHVANFFLRRKARENHNLLEFQKKFDHFKPDIVFIWGMWNLPRSLQALAEYRSQGKIVYRFADYWPTLPSQHELYWRSTGRTWATNILKMFIRPLVISNLAKEKTNVPLKFEHAICVSAATREELLRSGISISDARVIHSGIDIHKFVNGSSSKTGSRRNDNLKLLYAGRLTREKGVDVIIKAMSILVKRKGLAQTTLSIAGSGSLEFESYLRKLTSREDLTKNVVFLGQVHQEKMPDLYQDFDILIVPSIWNEPFSRVVLEGMASGLVIIATGVGGTSEILVDNENGLLFEAGSSQDLAEKIARLVRNPGLLANLVESGRKTVIENYGFDTMMDQIENYIQEIALPG